MSIEAVIFDWGGVLIEDPAPGLMSYCASTLGVPQDQYTTSHQKYSHIFQTGQIMEHTFWEKICFDLGCSLPVAQSLWYEAFYAVYKPRTVMFQLVTRLQHQGIMTALLSNTEPPCTRFFKEQHYDIFDIVMFSCIEGIAKPEIGIYLRTIHKLKAAPQNTVMIDDRPEFIQGAIDAGLRGIIFRNIPQILEDIKSVGIDNTLL